MKIPAAAWVGMAWDLLPAAAVDLHHHRCCYLGDDDDDDGADATVR